MGGGSQGAEARQQGDGEGEEGPAQAAEMKELWVKAVKMLIDRLQRRSASDHLYIGQLRKVLSPLPSPPFSHFSVRQAAWGLA